MHSARRDLSLGSPKEETVATIAYRHGFYHPARFAEEYRRLFGELPSVTLKQPSRLGDPELLPLLR